MNTRAFFSPFAAAAFALAAAAGCSGGTPSAALPTEGKTWLPTCSGNNDGIISVGELQFIPGLLAPYAVQRTGDTPVEAQGDPANGRGLWDFSRTNFQGLQEVETLSPRGFWYADAFPQANLAIPLDPPGGTPGHLVLRQEPELLTILGFASTQEGRALLHYTAPVPFMQFPMAVGDARSATVSPGDDLIFEDYDPALLGELDISDTYTIDVSGRGVLRLPGMEIDNVLALSVRMERTYVDLLSSASPRPRLTTTAEQTYLVHECLGTVGVRSGAHAPWQVIWYPQ